MGNKKKKQSLPSREYCKTCWQITEDMANHICIMTPCCGKLPQEMKCHCDYGDCLSGMIYCPECGMMYNLAAMTKFYIEIERTAKMIEELGDGRDL